MYIARTWSCIVAAIVMVMSVRLQTNKTDLLPESSISQIPNLHFRTEAGTGDLSQAALAPDHHDSRGNYDDGARDHCR